jgi:histidinol dehydrogenase
MKQISLRGFSFAQIEELLKKPAFDEVAVSEGVKGRIRDTFGEELAPEDIVKRIVTDIRKKGDMALLEYVSKIEGANINAAADLEVSKEEWEAGIASADSSIVAALQRAADNVRRFHEEQKTGNWSSPRGSSSWVGQRSVPMTNVGLYVPGGTASYPSSVLMSAIPAKVAGVRQLVMTVPPAKNGTVSPYVLAAARIAGVNRIFRIGGAQAVAAMAFGTETVPKVDKIVGPGNLFVTLAKKMVYGHCDIDMLAGPSEIMIVADRQADARYVAADLLSQAEHDELAGCILVTDSADLARQVQEEIERQLALLPRQATARVALDKQGMILLVETLEQMLWCVNSAAPEHLELLLADPEIFLDGVYNAGAVFVGPYSPEPLGDYYAGPSHVLPTGGTARFASVLNVDTFMKKMSVICYSAEDLAAVADDVTALAETEGLQAHAQAVRVRSEKRV